MGMMILIFTTMLGATAGAECTICGKSDDLITKWNAASTKAKRGRAMRESYKLLEAMVPKFEAQGKDPNHEDVGAAARLLGAIYVRDQDPRKDILRLYRKLIENPAFMKDFEDQLERMPAEERDKIKQGIRDLPNFD